MDENKIDLDEIKELLLPLKAYVKRAGSGQLPYDYLIPGGPFQAQYDWDSFFMGVALAEEISSEAIYLKNTVLNYIFNTKTNGKVSGCISVFGNDQRFHHIKPFLAQSAFFAGKYLKDFSWIKKIWPVMKKIILYRERYLWNKKYDLGVWYDGLESGMDNNVVLQGFPHKTVIAVDLNTYMIREFKSMKILAGVIGRKKDESYFKNRVEMISDRINKYLWNETEKTYFNIDSQTGKQIKRIVFSNFIPLFEGIISDDQAKDSIRKYLLSSDYLWSEYGIRTLSKNDKDYNNKSIIRPFSNWQGPIWPLINYIGMQILINYGFFDEALDIAIKTTKLILSDFKQNSALHENYDAETGKPLAADNKISWNLLVGNMINSAKEKTNPFEIKL